MSKMSKLLAAYRADPVIENARKLAVYALKHPFAECMLTIDDHAFVVLAKRDAGM